MSGVETVHPSPLAAARPPAWLFAATGVLALIVLLLAVAETTLWMHYLIDGGEYLSLVGLGFILVAGLFLFRQGRLFVSMPLVAPWLLYPVVTQGDQIIDNLSINPMRIICQVLLAAIFAAPVAVIALAARYALTPKEPTLRSPARWTAAFPGLRQIAQGRPREGVAALTAALFALEMWVAHQFLGTLMVVTLIVMILGALAYGSRAGEGTVRTRGGRERLARILLVAGVAASFALYIGYKNRPGAYQGSPSAFMDPTQNAGYRLGLIAVPMGQAAMPASPEATQQALTAYGRALERLLAGYYVLDRNYTWDFHNELFLRQTPLLPDYRAVGLQKIEEAHRLREEADARAATARPALSDDDPLAALLDDVRAYVAFNFDRAPTLEKMSAEFERTKAGLQHAAHLYEGEGKFLSARLSDLMQKHHAALESPAVAPVTSGFAATGRSIVAAYAGRIVGF